MPSNSRSIWLWILVIVSLNVYFRFYGLGDFSLSNDELSAVVRLQAASLTDLIEKGVVATDPHPAGSQVFLYCWAGIFGTSPLALRLPFAIMSLLAWFFLFALFRRWAGTWNALMAVGFSSMLSFMIIHGQLARPYAMAFLATSSFAWSWNEILIEKRKGLWLKVIYVLSASLACYTHYFAGLFTGLIAFVGLFIALKEKKTLSFLFLNLFVLALFMPHLPVTTAQLKREGLTAWIPLPESNFIWEHIFVLLNKSYQVLVIYMLLFILGLIKSQDRKRSLRWAGLSLIFFLMPMAVGYLYTMLVGPALMDRVLYFSAPFFLVLPFLFMPPFQSSRRHGLLAISILVPTLSTSFESDFAGRYYTEDFKSLALVADGVEDAYGNGQVLFAGNFNSPKYLQYYSGRKLPFTVDKLVADSSLNRFMYEVRQSDKSVVLLEWACSYQSIESVEYARLFYPVLVEEGNFYNSGYWLFGRGASARDTLKSASFAVDSSGELKGLDRGAEFVNILSARASDLKGSQVVLASCSYAKDIPADAMLVIQLKSPTGENLLWKGKKMMDFISEDRGEVILAMPWPADVADDSELAVYLWNPSKADLNLKSAWCRVFGDSFYPDLY